jgi:hypothetical protein
MPYRKVGWVMPEQKQCRAIIVFNSNHGRGHGRERYPAGSRCPDVVHRRGLCWLHYQAAFIRAIDVIGGRVFLYRRKMADAEAQSK